MKKKFTTVSFEVPANYFMSKKSGKILKKTFIEDHISKFSFIELKSKKFADFNTVQLPDGIEMKYSGNKLTVSVKVPSNRIHTGRPYTVSFNSEQIEYNIKILSDRAKQIYRFDYLPGARRNNYGASSSSHVGSWHVNNPYQGGHFESN